MGIFRRQTALLKFVLLPLAVLCFSFHAVAAEKDGPETGGGGNAVEIDGHYYLIDIFNVSTPSMVTLRAVQNHPEIGRLVHNETPENIQKVAIEVFKRWGLDVSPFALSRTELLPAGGVHPISKLPVQIRTSDEEIISTQYYFPFYLPKSAKVYQAAYYANQSNSVLISSYIWSRLGSINKLGLIIHENMRYLQLGLGHRFNDEVLQKATLMMLICKPRFQGYIVPLTVFDELINSKIFDHSDRLERCLKEGI